MKTQTGETAGIGFLLILAIGVVLAGIGAVCVARYALPVLYAVGPQELDLSAAMGDVDVWAGLSAPHVEPKPSPEDRKRAEAKTCIAQVVYGEARGEVWSGQVAVAQVVMRRAGLDWRHACAEAHKPSQFAPVAAPRSHEAWQWALAAADEALRWSVHGGVDHSQRASHFYSGKQAPYWVAGYEHVASIGGHAFYR